MKTSAIIYFVLCAVCVVVALIIFFNGLGVKALWFILFGIGAAYFSGRVWQRQEKTGRTQINSN